ncbi:SLC13 family permease [Desulfosediminicola sp.]|uniref:SLC13 family permease n=1 Tax=Desulfosediminicola sp. TaxID=2886825 RepID=UPI003AF24D0E
MSQVVLKSSSPLLSILASSKDRVKIRITSSKSFQKNTTAAVLFMMVAACLAFYVPSVEIAWITTILLLTIYLFAFEIVEIDVAAITILVLLGLSSWLAPVMGLEHGLVTPDKLFNGFSSNAVMSIIAVMIIGAGLDKTGIMGKVASSILNIGGTSEKRVIPIVSGAVAIISSFMQNVGATALFLPVVYRISQRSGLPMSRLLMPMGFCAILGGTVTMVGSSPLILLNDLILASNSTLPDEQQMQTWSLFSTTPIGLALVAAGIIYFLIAGRFVLPASKKSDDTGRKGNTMQYFNNVYGVDYKMHEVVVPTQSFLIGKTLSAIEDQYAIRVIATQLPGRDTKVGPGAMHCQTVISAGMVLAIVSEENGLTAFVETYRLKVRDKLQTFAEDLSAGKAGFAEVVLPPGSSLIGNTSRDAGLRKTHGIAMLGLHRDGKTMHEDEDISHVELHSGDTLVVHTTWNSLMRLEKSADFVVITREYPREVERPHKLGFAAFFFAISLSMVLFTDIRLSVALLTGAIGMILSGVLSMDEAYRSVSWKTVFLLAGLIPLGLAVEQTGTARWIADQTIMVVGEMPVWVIQFAIAMLATFFTLVMSNVGATVLLVPLAVNIALGIDANPAVFALTVAIATSNAFILPTHQVSALIIGPGGYRVSDFIRAGSFMTILFLVISIGMMNVIF